MVARGWCGTHYSRWRLHGDPLSVKLKTESCSIAGCAKPFYGRSMCAMHWHQWRKYGDPLHRTRMKQPEHCTAQECDRRPASLGYCSLHLQRFRKYGSTDLPAKPSVEQRFWAKVNKTPDCWLWTGSLSPTTGYGTWDLNGRKTSAHRCAYELAVGSIPPGLHLDHLCRNRPCVRPDHLEPVTPSENNARIIYPPKNRCPQDHALEGHNLVIGKGSNGRATRVCRECKNAASRRTYWARRRPA